MRPVSFWRLSARMKASAFANTKSGLFRKSHSHTIRTRQPAALANFLFRRSLAQLPSIFWRQNSERVVGSRKYRQPR